MAGVEGGGLMRVLAIAQRRRAAHRDGQHRRERLGLIDRAEPACDRAVIGCGGGEGLGGEQATLVEAGLAGRDDGRTMLGPPMSMFSITVSRSAPRATVASNG
ncbi:hypothetical protein WR25_03418 [Diploscapter pachys]|uniref:Uncharacterized protein n=1 Tax=Diploscapter pachys TaxID=2018661 RepID=A0A2A2M5S3_9BILA|nr:hypothetical protein WR25_03418 [Diploscapter pachys]